MKLTIVEPRRFAKERQEYRKLDLRTSLIASCAIITIPIVLRMFVTVAHPPPWPLFLSLMGLAVLGMGVLIPWFVNALPTDVVFHPDKIETKRIGLSAVMGGMHVYGAVIKQEDIVGIGRAARHLVVEHVDGRRIPFGIDPDKHGSALAEHVHHHQWNAKLNL